MGKIDVSFLLTDPDFCESFTIIKRTAGINQYGENVIIEDSEPAIGVIESGSNDLLARLPDGAVLSEWIAVYTKSELNIKGAGVTYADLIEYKGQRYQIPDNGNYMNWGGGWNRADCVMEGTHA